MRLQVRDLVATALVLAIAVPYVGYLVNGSMPYIEDARGMAAVGLLLGALAFVVMRSGDELDRVGKVEATIALVSLGLRPARTGPRPPGTAAATRVAANHG